MTKAVATLTIGERLATLRIFDGFKGSVTDLASVLEDVKKVAISSDEWKAAAKTIIDAKGVPKADQEAEPAIGDAVRWNEDDAATHKEISLTTEGAAYLAKTIKDKSDKGEITMQDVNLISLSKKLS